MAIKWWRILLLLIVVLVVIYLLGPHLARPVYEAALPAMPAAPAQLEAFVTAHETAHHLKHDNRARIIWADSSKRKTKYVMLYLHGFSASQWEGDPVHREFAKQFGCNLYLSRLAEHGIDTTEPMVNLTADTYWNSAKGHMPLRSSWVIA